MKQNYKEQSSKQSSIGRKISFCMTLFYNHWVSMLQMDLEFTSADEFTPNLSNDSELHFINFFQTSNELLKTQIVKVDSLLGHGRFSIHASYTCCSKSATMPNQSFLFSKLQPSIFQSSNIIYYLLYSYYFKSRMNDNHF